MQYDMLLSGHSKLVSTEAALDFLSELRGLNCGTALEQKMMSKSTDLIRQFGKEVDATSIAFHERKVSIALSCAPRCRCICGCMGYPGIVPVWVALQQAQTKHWLSTTQLPCTSSLQCCQCGLILGLGSGLTDYHWPISYLC